MSDPAIHFVVPANVDTILNDLATQIVHNYGVIEFLSEADQGDIEATARYLAAHVGDEIHVEFEGSEDNAGVYATAKALDRVQGVYIGYWPAFTEKSRGDRYDGGFLYRLPGGEATRCRHDWSHGDPELDVPSLRTAGIGEEDVALIESTFLSPGGSPSP